MNTACVSIVKMSSPYRLSFVAFFGRTFDEYMQMFSITPEELRKGRTLDCPSGPDSFIAEGLRQGLDVVGCDPMYQFDASEIHARGKASIDATFEELKKNPDSLHHKNLQEFTRNKYLALEAFAADYALNKKHGRYVHASLPKLPFADGSFDRVLTANFLMLYACVADGGLYDGAEFDLDFHLRSVDELARVSKHEIRMSPTRAASSPWGEHPYLQAVMERLRSHQFTVELVPSVYDDGFGTDNHLLVARRSIALD